MKTDDPHTDELEVIEPIAERIQPMRLPRLVPFKDQRCSNCQFSVRIDHHNNEAYLCRRFPPAPVPSITKNIAGQMQPIVDFHYPNMKPHGWCGEWQPEIKGNA